MLYYFFLLLFSSFIFKFFSCIDFIFLRAVFVLTKLSHLAFGVEPFLDIISTLSPFFNSVSRDLKFLFILVPVILLPKFV